MSRERSTNRSAALKLWLKSGRTIKLAEIAEQLGVSDTLIRKWKYLDMWDEIPAKRPRGAPKGNKNAKGNKGGGAPKGNLNSATPTRRLMKFLPQNPEFQELMRSVREMEPLDMLWLAVEAAFAKLLWAQKIMFVSDKDDMSKELKREKPSEWGTEEEYEIQFAHDKQATDIKAFATISREFRAAMKQFLSAAPENDERRLKLDLMQAQIAKAQAEAKALEKPSDDAETGVTIVEDIPRRGPA